MRIMRTKAECPDQSRSVCCTEGRKKHVSYAERGGLKSVGVLKFSKVGRNV